MGAAAKPLFNKWVVRFDGMTWPRAGEEATELDWRLRYAPDVSRSDLLMAASIIGAYRSMVWDPRSKRERVIREIRKIEDPHV
jgi:hypothetical protein